MEYITITPGFAFALTLPYHKTPLEDQALNSFLQISAFVNKVCIFLKRPMFINL